MKAIICEKTGPPEVLQYQEVAKPIPKDNEVLVKVHAGTVTIGDVLMRDASFFIKFLMVILGYKMRKIPGTEFAGEIEAIGNDVKLLKKGDQVFGTTTGLIYGANAEYVCVPEKWKQGVIAKKPTNASYEEAAALPVGGMTALFLLRKANIQKGQTVLVYGASGSVGTYAVQLAKSFGATVTGVCSTSNLEMAKSIGADFVIDYTKEDFTKKGTTYDVIFNAYRKISKSQFNQVLKNNGIYVSIKSLTKERTIDMIFLKKLVENEKLKPVIDRKYPLEKVIEAHRYVEKGHKKGNVVITIIKV